MGLFPDTGTDDCGYNVTEVYPQSNGTTIIVVSGGSAGTWYCPTDEFDEALRQTVAKQRLIEFLDHLSDKKICATRDSWAHLRRLRIAGRTGRVVSKRFAGECPRDIRCRSPPL